MRASGRKLPIVMLYNMLYNNRMRHSPNPESWRPALGPAYVTALVKVVEKRNQGALTEIGALDWLRKMIHHWYVREFPGEPFPGDVSEPDYFAGPDVQSG